MKVKALTFVELVIVLLISSIVMAGAYYAYLAVGKMYRQTFNNAQTTSQVNNLYFILEKDIFEADSVLKSNNQISIHKNEEVKHYNFHQKQIIRTTMFQTDTFKFENITPNFKTQDKQLKTIQITITENKIPFHLFVKVYSFTPKLYTGK